MALYDTNLTIAVRCAECGRIKFHNISLFELRAKKKIEFYCECKKLELTLTLKDNKFVVLNIPCVACDIVHTYKYNLKDILSRRVTVICCIDTEFELCFIGNYEDTRNMVYKYQEGLSQLLGELGVFQIIDENMSGDMHKTP